MNQKQISVLSPDIYSFHFQMDPPNADRRKKKDKAKEKFDRNGGHSQKHVRIAEALAAKKAAEGQKKN